MGIVLPQTFLAPLRRTRTVRLLIQKSEFGCDGRPAPRARYPRLGELRATEFTDDLERCACKRTVGSNPFRSARYLALN
jgi:hypothetical protein